MQKVMMLAAKVQLGSANFAFGMKPYVYTCGKNGRCIINLSKTWGKIRFAGCIVVSVEDPRDVLAISSEAFGQRAVHTFSSFLGGLCINQRFTPESGKPNNSTINTQICAVFRPCPITGISPSSNPSLTIYLCTSWDDGEWAGCHTDMLKNLPEEDTSPLAFSLPRYSSIISGPHMGITIDHQQHTMSAGEDHKSSQDSENMR
jgi:hypothetical protein